ncbi:MAG TPA: NAD-dependent epimerase/dehydratase family protein [Polyangia bacterium]
MTRILVTGAKGFLGRHVTSLLAYHPDVTTLATTRETSPHELREAAATADAVIHLAGVNRPNDEKEFMTGNVELTRTVTEALLNAGKRATFVLASSARADEQTAYARSKRDAEAVVREYAARSGATVVIDRLPNVFGKWSRPFYNSAVATFCHSIARDLPVDVHDERTMLRLVYGEDAAHHLIAQAKGLTAPDAPAGPVYDRTLGDIVDLLRQFRALRTALVLPDFSDDFVRKLYTTYVAFLPREDAAYALRQHTDERGALAELLKSKWFGQLFVSRTKPGITRGNHFHQTKTEKFIVVEGEAVIRLRAIEGGEVTAFTVRGDEFRVVDIPPGLTHSITNVGAGELVTLFWSSEVFDRERPDTYALQVLQ